MGGEALPIPRARFPTMSEAKASTDVNYESLPQGMAMDETDVNLRFYFSNMPNEKLAEYVSTWTDDV